jgi:hypothetical protein
MIPSTTSNNWLLVIWLWEGFSRNQAPMNNDWLLVMWLFEAFLPNQSKQTTNGYW